MTLTAHVLRQPEARMQPGSYLEISLGLPWFRSLPMSSILGVAGRLQESEDWVLGQVLIDGKWLELQALAELSQVEWYVQDLKQFRFSMPELAQSSPNLELEVKFDLLMPNLFIKPGEPVVIHTSARGIVSLDD
jgi:hypothetical protein